MTSWSGSRDSQLFCLRMNWSRKYSVIHFLGDRLAFVGFKQEVLLQLNLLNCCNITTHETDFYCHIFTFLLLWTVATAAILSPYSPVRKQCSVPACRTGRLTAYHTLCTGNKYIFVRRNSLISRNSVSTIFFCKRNLARLYDTNFCVLYMDSKISLFYSFCGNKS